MVYIEVLNLLSLLRMRILVLSAIIVVYIFSGQSNAESLDCQAVYSTDYNVSQSLEGAQKLLLKQSRISSIQVSNTTERFIQKLKILFRTDSFRLDVAASDVVSLSETVSRLSNNSTQNESILSNIETIKKKALILKNKSVPSLVRLSGRSEDYLNSVALEIKNDFLNVQQASKLKEASLELVEQTSTEIKRFIGELEIQKIATQNYLKGINETVALLENRLENVLSEDLLQSHGMVLNRLLIESTTAASESTWISASMNKLKKDLTTLDLVKNNNSKMSQIEMAAFLLETGLSLPFIESQVTARAAALEEKNQKALAKKEARSIRFRNIKNNVSKSTRLAIAATTVSVAGLVGSNHYFDPHGVVPGMEKNKPEVILTLKMANELGSKYDRSKFLQSHIGRLMDQLTPEEFSYYVNKIDSLGQIHANRNPHVIQYYNKHFTSLTEKQVVELEELTSLADQLRTHHYNFKMGTVKVGFGQDFILSSLDPEAIEVMTRAKSLGNDGEAAEMLITYLPRYIDKFTPEQFALYISEIKLIYGRHGRDLPAVGYYNKHINSLSVEQVDRIAETTSFGPAIKAHFFNYKKGIVTGPFTE